MANLLSAATVVIGGRHWRLTTPCQLQLYDLLNRLQCMLLISLPLPPLKLFFAHVRGSGHGRHNHGDGPCFCTAVLGHPETGGSSILAPA